MNQRLFAYGLVWAAVIMSATASDLAAQGLGVKGGPHLSAISFSDDFADSTALHPGLTGGAFVTFGLFSRTSISIEGLVTLERTKVEQGPEGRFRYLDVPVVVRRQLPWKAGGGSVAAVVGGAYRRLWEATETVGDETYSVTDGVRDTASAVIVGLEVPVRSKLSVDVRYLHGSRGVYRRARGGYSGAWRAVEVAARYQF